jgi:hypothetical protein
MFTPEHLKQGPGSTNDAVQTGKIVVIEMLAYLLAQNIMGRDIGKIFPAIFPHQEMAIADAREKMDTLTSQVFFDTFYGQPGLFGGYMASCIVLHKNPPILIEGEGN